MGWCGELVRVGGAATTTTTTAAVAVAAAAAAGHVEAVEGKGGFQSMRHEQHSLDLLN